MLKEGIYKPIHCIENKKIIEYRKFDKIDKKLENKNKSSSILPTYQKQHKRTTQKQCRINRNRSFSIVKPNIYCYQYSNICPYLYPYLNTIIPYLLKYQKQAQKNLNPQQQIVSLNSRSIQLTIQKIIKIHSKLSLHQQTLHLTIAYFQKYIHRHPDLSQKQQLISITCLFIASKYQQINMLKLKQYLKQTQIKFTIQQIQQMQYQILQELGYRLEILTVYQILCLLCKQYKDVLQLSKYITKYIYIKYNIYGHGANIMILSTTIVKFVTYILQKYANNSNIIQDNMNKHTGKWYNQINESINYYEQFGKYNKKQVYNFYKIIDNILKYVYRYEYSGNVCVQDMIYKIRQFYMQR